MMGTSPQDRVLTAYRERLAGLAGMKGRRNSSLLGLCNLGVLAGLDDGRIEAEIRAASGTPPLTEGEIRHALLTARRDTVPLAERPGTEQRAWKPAPPPPPPLGQRASSYVARMIARGQGATFGTLVACSPVAIPATPTEQAALFLRKLYRPWERIFCGDSTDRGEPGHNIRYVSEWLEDFANGATVPPFLIANPLTGHKGVTKEGKLSFRCGECVAFRRFALVEFDAMPLEGQCAFWLGS